jgi:hypothetical protein
MQFFSSPADGGGFGGNMYFGFPFKVTKRAIPTLTWYNPVATTDNTVKGYYASTGYDLTPAIDSINDASMSGYVQRGGGTPTLILTHWVVQAEL